MCSRFCLYTALFRSRTAVARALAMDPKVLLADEPSGNLDRANAEILHELLTTVVNDLEIGMVVVTHNRSLAARANRVLLLEGGRLTETVVEGVVGGRVCDPCDGGGEVVRLSAVQGDGGRTRQG